MGVPGQAADSVRLNLGLCTTWRTNISRLILARLTAEHSAACDCDRSQTEMFASKTPLSEKPKPHRIISNVMVIPNVIDDNRTTSWCLFAGVCGPQRRSILLCNAHIFPRKAISQSLLISVLREIQSTMSGFFVQFPRSHGQVRTAISQHSPHLRIQQGSLYI